MSMEYRKLISFGKSSYVVSLPRSWIKQNKLVKGDLIHIEENGPSLVLSKKTDVDTEEKEKVISIDGKDIPRIEREVNAAYIANFRKIILRGKELKGKIKDLQAVVQGLIALEIMEQTSDSIVAKDFLNMDKVSIQELIRKMDVVTRTMLKESAKIFTDDNYQNINERDKDVNRLYFLLYRGTLYNLSNPMKAIKNFNLSAVDSLKLQSIGYYIEGLADEARRFARHARQLSITAQEKLKMEQMMNKIIEFYIETMKAFYADDIELSLKLSEQKKKFNEDIDELEERNKTVLYYTNATSRMRRMLSYLHNIGRPIYTIG